MNEKNININLLSNALKHSGCTILSIVIIESAYINDPEIKNANYKKTLAVINITHTDSYNQFVNLRINSLYTQLNAKLIFPLCIWKNNICSSLESTGNINRNINNNKWLDLSNYRLCVGLDNIKHNIPKQNYILNFEVISIFNEICQSYNMELLYSSIWNTDFENKINSLISGLESTYNIKITKLDKIDYSLTIQQLQYFKQHSI